MGGTLLPDLSEDSVKKYRASFYAPVPDDDEDRDENGQEPV
jgi:hypothetical protein